MTAIRTGVLSSVLVTQAGLSQGTQGQLKPPGQAQVAPEPEGHSAVECSDRAALKACNSFRQLLEGSDKEVLDHISVRPSYVCFRPDADEFVIAGIDNPIGRWEKDDKRRGERRQAVVFLIEYRDGLRFQERIGFGYWHRRDLQDHNPTFEAEQKTASALSPDAGSWTARAKADNAEIEIGYSFTNQSDSITEYALSIRRSTGRFYETFTDQKNAVKQAGTCRVYR